MGKGRVLFWAQHGFVRLVPQPCPGQAGGLEVGGAENRLVFQEHGLVVTGLRAAG